MPTLHAIATQVLEDIIRRAQANEQEKGHWWDDDVITYREPSRREMEIKLASVTRRLKKADEALEALLTPQEREWHRKTRSPLNEVGFDTEALYKLYASIRSDEKKVEAYRTFGRINESFDELNTQLEIRDAFTSMPADEDEESLLEQPFDTLAGDEKEEDEPTPATCQLSVDWPNNVETEEVALGVLRILEQALLNAGYDEDTPGITLPENYYLMGKLALDIYDPEHNFDEEELHIDWQEVRAALADLEPELSSSAGWKKMPSAQGNMYEKVSAPGDLQTAILVDICQAGQDSDTYWKRWTPEPHTPSTGIFALLCDAEGMPLTELPEDADVASTTLLDEDEEGLVTELIQVDTSRLHHKVSLESDVAHHYLKDLLNVGQLDIPAPGMQQGRGM